MNKLNLNAKNFNTLKRDPNGAKSQRIWFSDYKGLGVDLGKSKKTFIKVDPIVKTTQLKNKI